MTAETNLNASRRLVEEGFNQGNLDLIDELCSPDVVTHDPAQPEDVRGIAAHRERMQGYFTAMPDMEIQIEDIIASRDRVVTRWTVSGTNNGELEGLPPTNRAIKITGMSIDRFDAAGKIAEVWDQWDNYGFMQQLGVLPEEALQSQ